MQENTGIPSWNMILRQRVMGSSRDDATQFLHLQRSAFLLWLVDHWKSRHYVGSKRLDIMKQRNIPEQQNLQIHRCVNRRTECQNMFLPSAAMRHCMIIEHAQCEADNAIFVQKFRKSSHCPTRLAQTTVKIPITRWIAQGERSHPWGMWGYMAERNGVEVLYLEVKPLQWRDYLVAPFVSVQIIIGLPTMTKAERSGPGAVGLCIFYRSTLVTNTCVVGSSPY